MNIKLFVPDREPLVVEAERQHAEAKPTRKKHPRCACGCGKAAFWPHDGKPVFHTRLCGYLMALKMVRQKKAK